MKTIFYIAIYLLFTYIFAAATPLKRRTEFQLKQALSSCPDQWTRVATPSPDYTLQLHIGLKKNRPNELVDQLHKISDPDHELYGNYLSTKEIRKLIEPSDESIMLVKEWLAMNGFNEKDVSFSSNRDWMYINAPMDVVQDILKTEYHVFKHDNGLDEIVRALSYSLPEYLHDHIDVIHPTTYFSINRRQPTKFNNEMQTLQRRTSSVVNSDIETIPVNIFRTFYKTIDYVPKATEKNIFAVMGFDNEVAIRTDLQLYLADERPDAVGADFNDVLINGGENNQSIPVGSLGEEGNLDIQTAFGVTYPTPIEFISVGGSPPFNPEYPFQANSNEPYLQMIEYFLSLPDDKLPRTITISYADTEQTVPLDYAKRVCDGFAQIGLRGVSILSGSGDYGVGGSGEECVTYDEKNSTAFLPTFPASCPYVTSVGATRNFYPEVAEYGDFYGGGGFSNYFSRPEYQNEVVSKYLDEIGDLHQGLYNSSGRGVPDVAAQGHKFKIYWKALPIGIGGTSAATPLFSSIVALLNDHLLSENKKPLGFLNPFLYKKGYQGLNDILQGASEGCNTTGFPAKSGWDAVTGLGTPDFQKLLHLVDSA